MCVLIVDDDAATRTGLSELLSAAGYETLSAATFQEAVRILSATSVALLITDVRLTDGDGLQLMSRNSGVVPTIVLTGIDDQMAEREARREGAIYLVKPVSPGKLLEEVKRVVSPKSRW